jgi:uncharacterized membrane protein
MKQNNTTKRILFYNGLLVVAFLLLYFTHQFLVDSTAWKAPFSLFSIYLFFGICSLVLITGIELLFDFNPTSAAYAFLVGIFLKMGLFMLIFFAKGLAEHPLNFTEKIGILLPLFSFLSIEAAAIISRLKKSN